MILLSVMLNPGVDPNAPSQEDQSRARTVLKTRCEATKVPGDPSLARKHKEDRSWGFTRRDLRPGRPEYDEWDDFQRIDR
jgi:hypothetical protein